MSKIKVLHITQATIGGTLEYIKLFFSNIDKDKYEVSLICPSYGPMKEEIENMGVKVYPIEMSREINVKSDIKNFIELNKEIKKINPDLVHLHSSKAGVLGKVAAYLNRVPSIYNAHGWAFSMNISDNKKKIYALIEKYTSIFCDVIVNISDYEYKLAERYNIAKNNKMVTIHNGIDINEYNNKKIYLKEEVSNELNIPNNSFVVGMVARISEQKNPMEFVKIAKKVCDKIDNAYFVLVGDGEQRLEVEDLIKQSKLEHKIKITGWTSDVYKYISVFDIGVLTSKWEGFGLVLAEYMAASKPVVASNVGGIPELIRDNHNGNLIDLGNTDEFVKSILNLYEDSNLVQKYIENSHKILREKFDIKKVVSSHEELYSRILKDKK